MPQGKRVEWEDLGNLRHELFHVWAFGGDTGWAEASWRRLTGLGLTDYDVENERRIVLIRFFTLACIYNSFCIEVFEEGYDLEDLRGRVDVSELLPVDDSAVDPESSVEDGDDEWDGKEEMADDEYEYERLRELVDIEHPKLVSALTKAFGGEWVFFGYLWISCNWEWHGAANDAQPAEAFGLTSEQINNRITLLVSGGSCEIQVAPGDDEIMDLQVDVDRAILGAGWIENGWRLHYCTG